MRIVHVITGLGKAAGTTTFVENVVVGLKASGHNVNIAMSDNEFQPCDVMHVHGLWSGLLHKAVVFASRNKIPVVWSTHGMTATWSMRHKWWKKIPAWWLYQKRDLKSAAVIHCTTDLEVEWNKALGFKNCFVAPLGTHLPLSRPPTHDSNHTHTLLFVGRIYPVKGLVNLINAWGLVMKHLAVTCSLLPVTLPNWKLRIVGPDQAGHLACLKAEVQSLGLRDSVEFPGPKFGDELSREYDECDCLVLPSFTENFGATIVDAMAHGKPCIASTYTPWKGLKEHGCGWWVSNEPKELATAISEMMALPNVMRNKMGERGRQLVKEKYTWDAVVDTVVEEYRRILIEGRGL